MNTLLQIVRLLAFLLFASFASSALSITVGSVLGGASLDGAWIFPECLSECQDKDDLVDPAHSIASAEYEIFPQVIETSGDIRLDWYLYGDTGEDDALPEFMPAEDSLIRIESEMGAVPLPASFWLFGAAIIAFVGYSRRTTIDQA